LKKYVERDTCIHPVDIKWQQDVLLKCKVPLQLKKNINLNFWNFSDPIVEVNAVVRHFRQPWVLIRKIWQ
jgi:hypothetical protein